MTGYETPETLEANSRLRHKLEAIRARAGQMMTLGDTSDSERSQNGFGEQANQRRLYKHPNLHSPSLPQNNWSVSGRDGCDCAALPGSPAHDVAQFRRVQA